MFYIFIAESSAVLADSKTNTMTAGLVIGAGVFGIQKLDRIAAFYANWHIEGWFKTLRWVNEFTNIPVVF